MNDDGASIFEPADPVRVLDHRRSGRARYWAARRRFKLRHLRLRRRMSNARMLELWGGIAACPSYRLSDEEIANDVASRLGVRYNWGTRLEMPGTMELPR